MLEIDKYLDNLMESKGLVDLPESVHAQVKEDLLARLEKWLLIDLSKAIPDSESDKLEGLFNSNTSPEQLMAYFQEVVPNYQQVMQDSLAGFTDAYLSA